MHNWDKRHKWQRGSREGAEVAQVRCAVGKKGKVSSKCVSRMEGVVHSG